LALPRVTCLANGVFEENCYVLADPDTARAVLIDPGEDADLFLGWLEAERLTLEAIWLTHAHIDHVAGVAEVVQRTGVPVHLHPDDRPLYDHVAEQGAWLGVRAPQPPPPDHDLADGGTVQVGSIAFEVRHVPGHSPGSVAFVGYGVALVGDLVFAGSVGRIDLPGGSAATLLDSIRRHLLTLPDDTVLYPGHGPETTVGEERHSNPFLTGEIRLV